jgi:hypothetical protein
MSMTTETTVDTDAVGAGRGGGAVAEVVELDDGVISGLFNEP